MAPPWSPPPSSGAPTQTFRLISETVDGLPRGQVEISPPPGSEVGYRWSVDWPGLPGSMHRGVSFAEESIRVKGLPGTGLLRIYAEDPAGRRVQVLSREFRAE